MASTEELPTEDMNNAQEEEGDVESESVPVKRKRSSSDAETSADDQPEKRTKSDEEAESEVLQGKENGEDSASMDNAINDNVENSKVMEDRYDSGEIEKEEEKDDSDENKDEKEEGDIVSSEDNKDDSGDVKEEEDKSEETEKCNSDVKEEKEIGATDNSDRTSEAVKTNGEESEKSEDSGNSAASKDEKKSNENGGSLSNNLPHRSRKRSSQHTEVRVNGVSESNDDSSTGKSEDSEKENRRLDMDIPMDLSTKSNSTTNGNDIIMLSDSESEEEPLMNGDIHELTAGEILKRRKLIKHFESELRNEEAKLVLLKKLKQSQLSHQLQEHTSVNNKQPAVKQSASQPPPLVRGSQQQQQQQQPQARPAHSQPPQLMRGNQMPQSGRTHQQGPPPLVNMGGGQRVDNRRLQHMGYQSGMVPGQSHQSHGSHGSIMSNYRQSQSSQAAQAAQAAAQAAREAREVDNQTPAQRQAAAKMALRKQLEKTLLQIPPPKPPPPEMNFIPSLGSPDFISLLGLEEAVNYIIDAALISKGQKNPDEKMVCNPFTCIQCNTDFTPVWKREKAGSKNVICENCVTTNQKKALKQEHTNRLKSAFVKALQQEQEIERMQSQTTSSSSSNGNSSSNSSASQQQTQPQGHSTANSSSSSGSNSSGAPPSSLPSSVYKATSETIRQHQNFMQAHQAHQTALRMGQPLGMAPFAAAAAVARGGFPYQLPYGAKPSDLQLQRQYLLDMIPNKGAMSWRP
ncbi:transcriptional repressor p66-beta-like [Argopecten irradians]|uniref:transcriptional repressor p66-beta-like n=1 Tax=Argopecten irradians TaxID=31199 RepID=UPI00370FFD9D